MANYTSEHWTLVLDHTSRNHLVDIYIKHTSTWNLSYVLPTFGVNDLAITSHQKYHDLFG